MKSRKEYIRKRWYPILRGILPLVTLGFNLMMIRRIFENVMDDAETIDVASIVIDFPRVCQAGVMLFALLAVYHLVETIGTFRKEKLLALQHLTYVILSGGASALLLLGEGNADNWIAACDLYFLAALISRILALVRKRDKWNVILLVLVLLLTLYGALQFVGVKLDPEKLQDMTGMVSGAMIFLLVVVQEIAMIMPIAFTNVRMDILKKIIHKTYATEILLGIVLLIVAFSFILPAFEPGIDNFGDALWYCFAIVTTIGFGDLYAVSGIGRVMSVILGVYGIIVVSLITSIIVNFYGEMKKEENEEEEEEEKTKEAGTGKKETDSQDRI